MLAVTGYNSGDIKSMIVTMECDICGKQISYFAYSVKDIKTRTKESGWDITTHESVVESLNHPKFITSICGLCVLKIKNRKGTNKLKSIPEFKAESRKTCNGTIRIGENVSVYTDKTGLYKKGKVIKLDYTRILVKIGKDHIWFPDVYIFPLEGEEDDYGWWWD